MIGICAGIHVVVTLKKRVINQVSERKGSRKRLRFFKNSA
jgi:hypothetical protein